MTLDNQDLRIENLSARIAALEARWPAAADIDAAKILLSGQLPRQRVHWSQEIQQLNRLAVLGTIAIWTLFLQNHPVGQWEIGTASAISSILLALWRLYARFLDAAITTLYPAIAYYENVLGIAADNSAIADVRSRFPTIEALRTHVVSKTVGTRFHLWFDWLALAAIASMGVVSFVSARPGIFCCDPFAPLHQTGRFLLVNLISCCIVILAMNAFQTDNGRLRRLISRSFAEQGVAPDERPPD